MAPRAAAAVAAVGPGLDGLGGDERLLAIAVREACCHGRHVAAAVTNAAIAAVRRPPREVQEDDEDSGMVARLAAIEKQLWTQDKLRE